ncbi:tRNA sulfurtransferase ThiI [Halobacteriovorax sp. BALOs_7]|uniref:Probable tRNA sulfurtransferase n=1 Tax=Halobacteriovorax vibrionivorans TaxID=2152716 RepID=A0ABY0IHG6_9BACT|nr:MULTISPECIES: tRNA uracil 4-sulfurtransferase ThiI [Halobacteriovorax]AYF44179.1 tRNA sulfurtransferase ThiI [Halobacteriovorax sp. BALOs_7]RZF21301.1 tRNA 4-thiouridine(8) synthase ThiI [Halobacteriovorax vibrionivorans]TGD47941.1 tRNA 4-thiouridine(8) synthase ThiI [Halobacteriovorax sp. Y22]
MYKSLILTVDELWLKGKNRKNYYRKLQSNLSPIFSKFHHTSWKLKNNQQRLVVESEEPFSDELIDRLRWVPGLSSVTPMRSCPLDLDYVCELAVKEIGALENVKTFKVHTKRALKQFPKNSDEINRYMATALLKNTDLKVDVRNPDIMVDIKIMNEEIYLSWEKIPCVGGLPVGTSGHGVTLLSGGIDSPVASYMMARRGMRQTFAFFWAYPYVGEEVKDKIIELGKSLSRFQNDGIKLYVLPFGDIQNYLAKHCKEDYRTLFFRKLMMDASAYLARRVKANALVMGDALAQVSSQTIHNMSVLDRSCPMLTLRPLVGMNKIDIISYAKEIGTFETSIIPHDDACSMFAPKHPVIKADIKYFMEFMEEHDMHQLIRDCVNNAEVYRYDIEGNFTQK